MLKWSSSPLGFSTPHSSSPECEIARASGCCWRGVFCGSFSSRYLDVFFFFYPTRRLEEAEPTGASVWDSRVPHIRTSEEGTRDEVWRVIWKWSLDYSLACISAQFCLVFFHPQFPSSLSLSCSLFLFFTRPQKTSKANLRTNSSEFNSTPEGSRAHKAVRIKISATN